jgi:hypothetical protein
MMSESALQRTIREALGHLARHVRLFRNNSGVAFHADGSRVVYGVGSPGGSDLLGFTVKTVTPDMVGKPVAIFTAVEIKTPRGRVSAEQENFIRVVNEAGGLAAIVRSPEEALRLVGAS